MKKSYDISQSINLLSQLIETPSLSKDEGQTATVLEEHLKAWDIKFQRTKNNIWVTNLHFEKEKPSILLNSHQDTVAPNEGYTRDPFSPTVEDGKLYGLGSNDAGGCLVSLLHVFIQNYWKEDLAYNLVFVASAEEEISGKNGISLVIPELPPIDFAIIGEPTSMQMAIAEKGLLVIDGYAKGTAGHAAHQIGENAIYQAMEDIQWIKNYQFNKTSALLGEVKMTVTQLQAGKQHNVIPESCHFVVDVRTNECYSNEEVFEIINKHTQSDVQARSFRLNSSSIAEDHPVVLAGKAMGLTTYGSPTLSDQALLSCPSLKIGPGDTTRSHQADEFIYLAELEEGIAKYQQLLNKIL